MNVSALILRPADWPAQDQKMWRMAIREGGLFDDVGHLAHLSPPTLGMIQSAYGKWLGWLTMTQHEVLEMPPPDRLQLERFIDFAEANSHLSPKTQHLCTSNTLRLLHHAYPERDWEAAWRVIRRLKIQADRHVSHRKNGRILSGNHVLSAALDLAGPVAAAARTPLQRALLQRNGTIIAFLALMPLRRRAFTSLRLGEAVVFEDNDIRIIARPHMTKRRTHWETLVPPSIAPTLRRYIEEVRPQLMKPGRDHEMLWVTKYGTPVSGSAMSTLIRNQTHELFGVTISPHLFRDIAATTLARTAPEATGHIRALLDHTGHETAEKYYNQARTIEAARDYATVLEGLVTAARTKG